SATATREVWTASHAAVSSSVWVNPAPCRAHGTAATTTPCWEQATLGASASRNAWIVPRSSVRQRRRPSPWSYPGQRRGQTPQRRRWLLVGRTVATTACASSSYWTCSMTMCSTPSSRFHNLADRTPFHPPVGPPLRSRTHRRGAACSHGTQTNQPTDTAEEPQKTA